MSPLSGVQVPHHPKCNSLVLDGCTGEDFEISLAGPRFVKPHNQSVIQVFALFQMWVFPLRRFVYADLLIGPQPHPPVASV